MSANHAVERQWLMYFKTSNATVGGVSLKKVGSFYKRLRRQNASRYQQKEHNR